MTDAAVSEVRALLGSPGRRRAIARHNFAIARDQLSYRLLRRRLRRDWRVRDGRDRGGRLGAQAAVSA